MPDVEVRDLTVEFPTGGYVVRPLHRLSLDVAAGELVLLLGASGCGKTTLLSVLAGILTPSAGGVRVGDVEVTALEGDDLTRYRRHTVGVVFQAFNLLPSLTAWQNVATPLWAAGVGGRAARARALELLARVDLGDRAGHLPGRLSGGQQQRVAIARALALDPALVLADEPTAHLDHVQVEGVLALLRQLAGAGRTLVVATHDERLLPIADRIVDLSGPLEPVAGAVSLDPGEVLFAQGDRSDVVYVVEEGEIELVCARPDGGEEVISRVGPGRYFGELGPLYGRPRSATARAVLTSTVTGLTPHEFRRRSLLPAARPGAPVAG